MSVVEAYEDLADILANMAPGKIVALRAPEGMSSRVEALVMLKKEGKISIEESIELERYLALDLLINLAKAKQRQTARI